MVSAHQSARSHLGMATALKTPEGVDIGTGVANARSQ